MITPQGRREPEVFGAGLGLVPGHVILPDPSERLRERDKPRIGLMARRFAPDVCVTLDSGTAIEFAGETLVASTGAGKLGKRGQVTGLIAA